MSEVAQTEGAGMRDGLLGKAKTALRLTSDAFDDEVRNPTPTRSWSKP